MNTHIERSIRDGRLRPETLWTHLWGLALSTNQTHHAVAVLLAEKQRPNTLPLQASILVRSMLEALGNMLALTSAKCALRWFLADGYRRQFEQLEELRKDFAGLPKWDKWFREMDRVLGIEASWASLGRRSKKNPKKSIPEWPTPYWLTRARRLQGRPKLLPVLLRGNRARLFDEAYRHWYSRLSAYAHQRAVASRMAIFANNSDAHWEPGLLESNVTFEALTFFACVMSEFEVAARMPPCTHLRVLWSQLSDGDEFAKRLVTIRYRRILNLPAMSSTKSS